MADENDEGKEGDSNDDEHKGGKPSEGDETPPEFDVVKWLADQPEEARAALTAKFETDTAGLKSALGKEREARAEADKAKAELDKKQGEADDLALAEGKKFEELADKRKDELDASASEVAVLTAAVEKLEARAKKAEAAVVKNLEAQKAAMELKPHILKLMESMDPTDQLEYLAENAEALGAKKGSGILLSSPPENGAGGMTHEEKLAKAYKA